MENYYDRDTKVAYVEQINAGKLTVTEAVKELGCSRAAIYPWMQLEYGDFPGVVDYETGKMIGCLNLKGDLGNKADVDGVFNTYYPGIVVNLGAQVGVRYSIENPAAYIQSNIVVFFNILEACRHNEVEHLVYVSSSSVYGPMRKPLSPLMIRWTSR